jgi:hypothetical protein
MTTVAPDNHQQARLVVRVLLQVGGATYALGDAEMAEALPAMRELLAPAALPETASLLVSSALRERITTLCSRLGTPFPPFDQLDQGASETLLARLQAEEEDLLRTAEGAHTASSAEPSSPPIDKGLVRQLKERWRACTGAQGSLDEVRSAWERFKQQVCAETVTDRAMRADQYVKLLAALTSPSPERTRR